MLRNFKYQLYFGSVFMLVFSLCMMTFSVIHITKQTITNNSNQYVHLALAQTNKNLETTLLLAQDATNNILSHEYLQNNLVETKQDHLFNVLETKRIREIMNNVFRDSNLIQYMELETLNQQNINTGLCSNELINDKLRTAADKLNGRTYWFITEEKVCNSYNTETIIGVRKILNHQKLNENLGYLVFTIDVKFFDNILKQKRDLKEMTILLSQNGEVFTQALREEDNLNKDTLLRADWKHILQELQNDQTLLANEHLFSKYQSDYTEWTLIGIIPEKQITSGLDKIVIVSLSVVILLVLFNLILSSKFSSFISRPIQEIINKMKLVSSGNFNTPYESKKFFNIETEQLATNFNLMVDNIRFLVKEVYEKQNQERKAELRALQAQINPHFLYNTLDNIYFGLEVEGKSKTSELILALSKILRYAINRKSEVTSLEEELKHVDQYLYIMSYRFPGRFIMERNIPDHLLHCAIPRLLIQPIVENAITHGLEPRKKQGRLVISTELINGTVHLIIEDNGVGMNRERINSLFKKHERLDHKGLGILNVHERIRLHYGKSYGVKAESQLGIGTRITLTFPYSSYLSRMIES